MGPFFKGFMFTICLAIFILSAPLTLLVPFPLQAKKQQNKVEPYQQQRNLPQMLWIFPSH